MPAPVPFDTPAETLADAVSEQLDFASRIDVLERKMDVALERLSVVNSKASALSVDIGRANDVGTVNQLTLERVEKSVGELKSLMKKFLGAK